MAKNTLYLHIGTHKTGSTMIQKTLEDERNFKDEGIVYLDRYKPPVIEISERGHNNTEVLNNFIKKIAADIEPYANSKNLKFIISNEKLAGNKRIGYKNALDVAGSMKNILGNFDWEIKVVVYFRRQDDFIESLYSQRIYNGSPETFQNFIDQLDERSFCWEDVADAYAEHFGKENILVRRYHRQYLPHLDSIIQDFGKTIESSALQEFRDESSYNEGFSNSALKVIELINPHLDREKQKSIKKLFRKEDQKRAFHTYALFSYDQRTELLERYEESNARLAKKYLGIESGKLFPQIEEEYKQQANAEVNNQDLSVNFALAFHHLYTETKALNDRISRLEEQQTTSEKIIRKLNRIFKRKS